MVSISLICHALSISLYSGGLYFINMEANLLADFVSSGMLVDMVIGMAMGMAASPLMMKAIKTIRQKRKIDKLFHEIAETRKTTSVDSLPGNSEIL
jgi:membrane protease subunit (stomatin/prohibitin family)